MIRWKGLLESEASWKFAENVAIREADQYISCGGHDEGVARIGKRECQGLTGNIGDICDTSSTEIFVESYLPAMSSILPSKKVILLKGLSNIHTCKIYR